MKRLAVTMILAVTAAGCGSRMAHDEIVQAWHAGTTAGPLQAGPAGSGAGPIEERGSGVATPVPEEGPGVGPRGSAGSAAPRPGSAGSTGQSAGGGASAVRSGEEAPATGSGASAPTPARSAAAPTPGAPGPAPAGPTQPGAEIVVGSVSTVSGPIGGAIAGGVRAVQAWSQSVNTRGGLGGRPVRFIVADDGGDPARHRALVQQLVEQNKVVAFIYMAAPLSGQAALPYLLQKGVAAIGTEGGSSWVNESPIYFPQMSSFDFLAAVFAGPVAQEALKAGKKKLALFNCEFSACKPVLTADAFRKAGLDVVHEATASITQPDYTAECLAARNAGAEILFPQFTPDGIIRMAESCRNVGFKPLYAFEAQTMSPLFLKRPEFEGAIFSSPVAPFFLDLPATAEFRAAMARYAPKEEVNVSTSLGWVSAKLFERAVTRATNPAVTTADVLTGLRSVKDDDLGGLTYPLTFDAGAPDNATHEQSCWWTIRISAGRWTTPDGGERRCGS